MGGSLSSEQAHQISLGSETLALRVAQTSATALHLAHWLQAHPAIGGVRYPMLESHPQHAIAKSLFAAGSWLLSFELRDPSTLIAVLNRLQLPIKATGLGDNRTLIIPVAPTIFHEAGAQVRADMAITDGLIRLSLGLEDADDLIDDFAQALGRS